MHERVERLQRRIRLVIVVRMHMRIFAHAPKQSTPGILFAPVILGASPSSWRPYVYIAERIIWQEVGSVARRVSIF